MSLILIKELQGKYHKQGVNPDDWYRVKPKLLTLAEYVLRHCESYDLPVVFTSIIRPRLKVSTSDTHADGRAFDLSIKGWSKQDIGFMVDSINEKFSIGAISKHDNIEREAVYEDGITRGIGAHLHFQVRR